MSLFLYFNSLEIAENLAVKHFSDLCAAFNDFFDLQILSSDTPCLKATYAI